MTSGGSETGRRPTGTAPHHVVDSPLAVRRTGVALRPDKRRVILRPFLPDEEILTGDGLLNRILNMPEEDVEWVLHNALANFEGRHREIETDLERHFEMVASEAEKLDEGEVHRLHALPRAHRLLIGVYYSSEYSIEAAALTNPSVVPAPDQSGLEPGALRVVVSLRGVGEGHISSIEFRSGVIEPDGHISIEEPSRYATLGTHDSVVFEKSSFHGMLEEMDACDAIAESILDGLDDRFELGELETAITAYESTVTPRHISQPSCRAMHRLATSNYRLTFQTDSPLSERIIFPASAVESQGMEDARFVRFVDDDGSVAYYATYTAYDGRRILPQLIETTDFLSFRINTLSGVCAQDKGAALFPRKVNGRYMALSRYDGENNYVMESDNLRIWDSSQLLETPEASWDLTKIGNCGSPIETEAGWLVITHGVGPFRTYSLGAMLLDAGEPTRVIGRLREPLLTPVADEREGYVPNVVYSCGSLIHDGSLVVPYGMSDMASGFARVPLDSLLDKLV